MKAFLQQKKVYSFFITFFFAQNLFAQPTINSFTPTSGPVGTTVTITGNNFSPVPGNNIVYFGAAKAVVTSATATTLTVIVPVGASYQPISVLDISTGLTVFANQPFIVTFRGGGLFAPRIDLATGSIGETAGVAIGDLDGDGKIDLAMANDYTNTISIFRNTGASGTISFAASIDYLSGNNPRDICLNDLDGDGKLDIAVANYNTYGNGTVSVFRNTSTIGQISFAKKVNFKTNKNPQSISTGDFNGDGKPDIAVVNYWGKTVSVFKNTGAPGTISFAAMQEFVATTDVTNSVSAGDLNNDGKPDLVVTYYPGFSILKNTSAGGVISFADKVDYSTGEESKSVAIGDLDGDGKPDLAVANWQGNGSLFRNTSLNGTISFDPEIEYIEGKLPINIKIGDLDGDGKPDLAIANYALYDSGTVSVLKNKSKPGMLSFPSKVDYATGVNPNKVSIGDIDDDGKADLLVGNYSANTVSILRNVPCLPTPVLIAQGNPDICPTGSVQLSVNLTGALHYKWTRNNHIIPAAKYNTYTATEAGTYRVVVYTGSDCIKFSNLLTVINSCSSVVANNISISPNPSNGLVTVAYKSIVPTQIALSIYDQTGRIVFTKTEKVLAGNNVYKLNLSSFLPGTYNLQLNSNNENRNVKFIIQK